MLHILNINHVPEVYLRECYACVHEFSPPASSLPPFVAKQTGHLFPARAPGPSPTLQPPSLHLEGFSMADPDGLRDVGQGGILPAGFKGKGAPQYLCSPPPSTAGVHVVGQPAGLTHAVRADAVDHATWGWKTWGVKGVAEFL